jgi:hypothetical protein
LCVCVLMCVKERELKCLEGNEPSNIPN